MAPTIRSISFAAVLSACSLGTLLLASCSQNGSKFEGTWVGKRLLQHEPGVDPSIYKSLEKVELKILAGQHFELLSLGIPYEGRVRFEGERALLIIEQVMRRPFKDSAEPPKPYHFQLQMRANGTLFLEENTPHASPPVILSRESQPAAPKNRNIAQDVAPPGKHPFFRNTDERPVARHPFDPE